MAYDNLDEIRTLAVATLIKCKLQSLVPLLNIKFNDRLLTCLGEANFSTKSITLSSQMWRRAGDSERKEVIIHEICHLAADYYLGVSEKPHGKGWSFLMGKFGFVDAKTCHRVLPVNRHRVICGCGISTKTNSFLRRSSKGEEDACKKCFQVVKLLARAPTLGTVRS